MTTSTQPRTATMRAIAFTARERAEVIDLPRDGSPLGADEVAGTTLVSLASPGTELNAYLAERSEPVQSGYAAVFRVDAVGAEVSDVRPGDVVFCMGHHASHQRHARDRVVPVPAGLDPAVAVFCRLMGVSWSTLITTTARPPAQVLVSGLGPVGNLASQIFRASGYRVTSVDPIASRCNLARQHGIDAVEQHPREALRDRVDLAIDCSGHEQAVLDAVELVRRGGEVVLVGVQWRQRSDLSAHRLLHAVFHRYVRVRSGWEWEVPLQRQDFTGGSIMGNIAAALAWLADGRVRVDGLAEQVIADDAQRAWLDLRHQRGAPTRVFTWSP
ncbi:MAG: zinc-binding alcohol dehydrogenase [Planctomycetes bacterium]|nr:zinc-binding alcohol dehydrogenase [Planctomycetota bacterium]